MLGYKFLHQGDLNENGNFHFMKNESFMDPGSRILLGCGLNGNEHFEKRNYSFDLI